MTSKSLHNPFASDDGADAFAASFAPDSEETFHFKNRLESDLKGISAVYPDFRIAIDRDMLVLEKSPPLVPRLP